MGNFNTIQIKLEQFIKRYYANELLKGAILFFAIGLLYFLFTLFIEYVLWLSPSARTILFWLFVTVEICLFVKFIALPIIKLLKLQKGINYEYASKIIGDHFPEVNDKLLNVLQLHDFNSDSELLSASIDQKSLELSPIPFKLAINFKTNVKYLKYAAIPLLILALSLITGKMNWFNDSYERVLNYNTAYEPPAPFQFFVVNENLNAIENKDFKLSVKTVGDVIPENAQIHYNGESYFLQQNSPGHFEFVFTQPKEEVSFNFSANNVLSKDYNLEVVRVPTLISFEMVLDYPAYTRKKDEILKSTGNASVPEGTNVTWKVNTRSTTKVALNEKDTLDFGLKENGVFELTKRLNKNLNYSISTSNEDLDDYENLEFSINTIKDDYPEINLKVEKDSINNLSLYFLGQISDDYGLSKLQLVYYPTNAETEVMYEQIPISNSNFDEFVAAFPNQLSLQEGVNYELYFQVFDNDAIHKYKSSKSPIFTYRKLTKEEEEQKQLEEQNETIDDLNNSFEKLKSQDKELEKLAKTQKEKDQLNFNDKKKLQDFIKRQKQQEEMMQNFNKKLKDNLEEFQNENKEDSFKEELKDRLNDNEEQLKKDEKLLEELEKLQEKIQKEELSEKLEELAKQNKNKQRSLEQLLELTKRYYVAKKAEKLQRDLEELAEEQEKLSDEDKENNTKEAQEELNKKFEDFQKELEDLKKENNELKKPLNVPQDKEEEEDIKKEQQDATDELEEKEENEELGNEKESNQNQQNAKQKQKKAAQKMKQMSAKMMQSMMSGGGEQLAEDATMLRQILDNLVLFSFDQEGLMRQFRSIGINHNEYGKFLRKQSSLREHFEHIDDSLFSLSLRQPTISERVNSRITDVFYNLDKSLVQLSENQLYQGIATQQYTITATNDLASFLSDVLDNMEAQMNPSPGQGSGGDMQLPDIIKSQEELNEEMEDGMKKSQEGNPQSGKEGKEGEEGEGEKEGKTGNPKQGENGSQQGEGEGNSEEMNGELYRIYQRQQQLRQALQDKLGKEGSNGQGGDLIKKMEEVELDLLNKGFTNQTLQKMMELQHQLLKMENATFMQGEDKRRESETNTKRYNNTNSNQIPTAKEYFHTTEILNRQALPLQHIYKKKVQEYFKKSNDKL